MGDKKDKGENSSKIGVYLFAIAIGIVLSGCCAVYTKTRPETSKEVGYGDKKTTIWIKSYWEF